MKKIAFFIIFLLFSCGRNTPTLSPLSDDAVIVAFGDSLTYGIGAESNQSYPAILSGLIQHDIINSGVSGERTAEGLERLSAVLEEYKPNLLILCHGGNDFLQKKEDELAVRNISAMIQMVHASGAEVLLIGVPKPTIFLPVPSFYAEIAQKMNIPYEGKIMSDVLSQKKLKHDMVHPNAQGYQKIATAIATLLRQAKAIP